MGFDKLNYSHWLQAELLPVLIRKVGKTLRFLIT